MIRYTHTDDDGDSLIVSDIYVGPGLVFQVDSTPDEQNPEKGHEVALDRRALERLHATIGEELQR